MRKILHEKNTSIKIMMCLCRQDDDLEHYKQTGKFDGLPVIEVPKRYYDIFWFVFWVIITCIPLYHYVIYLVLAASFTHKIIVAAIVTVSK